MPFACVATYSGCFLNSQRKWHALDCAYIFGWAAWQRGCHGCASLLAQLPACFAKASPFLCVAVMARF